MTAWRFTVLGYQAEKIGSEGTAGTIFLCLRDSSKRVAVD